MLLQAAERLELALDLLVTQQITAPITGLFSDLALASEVSVSLSRSSHLAHSLAAGDVGPDWL